MFVMSTWVLTTSAIAMERYEKDKDLWKGNTIRTNTRNFLIFSLAMSILLLLAGIGIAGMAGRSMVAPSMAAPAN